MFVVHHEHEKSLHVVENDEMVETQHDDIVMLEHDEIDEIELIDDKLFIFINVEHQNRFLLMVELDEMVVAEIFVELIDVHEQLETIDGNVFIK